MSTIHFKKTTTATPEQFIAGLTDFGPGRVMARRLAHVSGAHIGRFLARELAPVLCGETRSGR